MLRHWLLVVVVSFSASLMFAMDTDTTSTGTDTASLYDDGADIVGCRR